MASSNGGRLRTSQSAASWAHRARSCPSAGRRHQGAGLGQGGQIWLDRASEHCSGNVGLVVAGGYQEGCDGS